MMIVLAVNLGERDLYYNVGSTSEPNFCNFERGKDDERRVCEHLECSSGARHISATILQRLQRDPDLPARLRYPIVRTVIDSVLGTAEHIHELLLFVTDQPEEVGETHRSRDSVNTGRILRHLIRLDYADLVENIRLVRYTNAPTNRERAYRFFGDVLPQLAPAGRVDAFYAALSGGVPALNDALQEQGLRLYKSKGRFFEVIPPDEGALRRGKSHGEARAISAGPFLRDLAVSIVEELIARHDYSGAQEVLETFRGVRFWEDPVEAVLQHAAHRLNFSFREAARVLAPFSSEEPIRHWYRSVQNPVLLDQLVETYFVAESRYRNREFLDLLWRVSAFYENGLRLLAARLLRMPALEAGRHLPVGSFKAAHPELEKLLQSDRRVRSRVAPVKIAGRWRDAECWDATTYFLQKLVGYGLKDRTAARTYQEPYSVLKTLQPLSTLRNEMVHNFAGVSEEDLDKVFKPNKGLQTRCGGPDVPAHKLILPTLRTILEHLDERASSGKGLVSPYEDINEYLRVQLRSG